LKYCTYCLQPDTRPNTYFTEGICPACNYFHQLPGVDWDERMLILEDIFSNHRGKDGKHDCIIGVSGGKDSTRQALWVRDKFNVNPLLVSLSYPPEQLSERGAENVSNLVNLGFDLVLSSPKPVTWQNLKRDGFEEFTNSFRSTELALFASVPQIAIQYGIELILWGENPALQLGDMSALGNTGYDANELRNMNTLSSGTEWMKKRGYKQEDLMAYQYPTRAEFEAANLSIVYLGWFMGDWSLLNNGVSSCLNGLIKRDDDVNLTGDLFGITALDEDHTPINQMIKYFKFGFGRTTDYVNEEIRLGRMTRKEGISVVSRYDHKCSDKYIKRYCDYLKISPEYFWKKITTQLNKDLFYIDSNQRIKPKFKVGFGI